MSMTILAITLALFCLSAFLKDAIGIHAIFGGFILGTVMPRGLFVQELKKKIEPLAVVLLLPMFFTYSGLNTRMELIIIFEYLDRSSALLEARYFNLF
jgi:Kef-type K+ transport system membrane component KefB